MMSFSFLKIIISASFFLFISCNKNTKFNKIDWQKTEDGVYIHREEMIVDLMKNYHLETLNYNEILKLLGNPENYSDKEAGIIYYNITTDYGYDIDPVFVKNLKVVLNNRSKINTIKLEVYNHDLP